MKTFLVICNIYFWWIIYDIINYTILLLSCIVFINKQENHILEFFKTFYNIFSNSSLEMLASFLIILFNNPLSNFSPGWFGTTVVRPSLCLKNIWLPDCLIISKPNFVKSWTSYLAVIWGNFDIYTSIFCIPKKLSFISIPSTST